MRTHPVTGEPALYLCEAGQLDWFVERFIRSQRPGVADGELLAAVSSWVGTRLTYVVGSSGPTGTAGSPGPPRPSSVSPRV